MLLDILGFVISSALYMFIQMCIFLPKELKSKRNYILFLVLAVVSPVLINILFVEVFIDFANWHTIRSVTTIMIIDGIVSVLNPTTFAIILIGVVVGIIFGSIPGLTSTYVRSTLLG